jgi:hypothetical protein
MSNTRLGCVSMLGQFKWRLGCPPSQPFFFLKMNELHVILPLLFFLKREEEILSTIKDDKSSTGFTTTLVIEKINIWPFRLKNLIFNPFPPEKTYETSYKPFDFSCYSPPKAFFFMFGFWGYL